MEWEKFRESGSEQERESSSSTAALGAPAPGIGSHSARWPRCCRCGSGCSHRCCGRRVMTVDTITAFRSLHRSLFFFLTHFVIQAKINLRWLRNVTVPLLGDRPGSRRSTVSVSESASVALRSEMRYFLHWSPCHFLVWLRAPHYGALRIDSQP